MYTVVSVIVNATSEGIWMVTC